MKVLSSREDLCLLLLGLLGPSSRLRVPKRSKLEFQERNEEWSALPFTLFSFVQSLSVVSEFLYNRSCGMTPVFLIFGGNEENIPFS